MLITCAQDYLMELPKDCILCSLWMLQEIVLREQTLQVRVRIKFNLKEKDQTFQIKYPKSTGKSNASTPTTTTTAPAQPPALTVPTVTSPPKPALLVIQLALYALAPVPPTAKPVMPTSSGIMPTLA